MEVDVQAPRREFPMQGFCSNPNCKRLIYDVEDESHLSVNEVIECQHCHTVNPNPRYEDDRLLAEAGLSDFAARLAVEEKPEPHVAAPKKKRGHR